MSRIEMRPKVASDLHAFLNSPDRTEAGRHLQIAVRKYEKTAPTLASRISENVPEGLTILSLPETHRRRLRAANMPERINKEIKRRTRVAILFPNEASLLRLASAFLMKTRRIGN